MAHSPAGYLSSALPCLGVPLEVVMVSATGGDSGIAAALAKMNCVLHEARRFEEAVRLMKCLEPAAVLMEETFPGGDWRTMLRLARTREEPPEVIVASRNTWLLAEVTAEGGMDALLKPYTVRTAVDMVLVACQRWFRGTEPARERWRGRVAAQRKPQEGIGNPGGSKCTASHRARTILSKVPLHATRFAPTIISSRKRSRAARTNRRTFGETVNFCDDFRGHAGRARPTSGCSEGRGGRTPFGHEGHPGHVGAGTGESASVRLRALRDGRGEVSEEQETHVGWRG